MTKPLDNRLALVTGASKGIGAATAQALAAAGAHVVLTGRDVRALEAVEDTIHAAGGASTIAPVDLAESDGIARLASAIASRWDKLDVLVAAAAYLPALLANVAPLLKRAEAGRVIGLTSSVGASPRAYWAAYGTTKAAFDNLLESYAQEVEKTSKVRVALVDPGATRTAMRAKAYPGEDPQTVKPPETVAERLTQLLVEGFDGFHRERVEA